MTSPKDMYDKIIYERNLINLENNENKNVYIIFNLILSINHLFDWVIFGKNNDDPNAIECIKRFNPYLKKEYSDNSFFRDYYSKLTIFPKCNEKQQIIREISNNIKHFSSEKKSSKVEKDILSVAGNIGCGEPNACCRYFEEYRYVIKNDIGKDLNLIELCDSLINEWKIYIDEMKL